MNVKDDPDDFNEMTGFNPILGYSFQGGFNIQRAGVVLVYLLEEK